MWTLASYARLFYWNRDDVLFQPVIGNQGFDARMIESRSTEERMLLEITAALDGDIGYQERLRREHLHLYGWVPRIGGVLTRDERTGLVEEVKGRMAISAAASRKEELERVSQAIGRKSAKSYGPNTALIVEFIGASFQSPDAREEMRLLLGGITSGAFCEVALVDDNARFGVRTPPLELVVDQATEL